MKRGDLLLRAERFEEAIVTYESVGDLFADAGFSVKAVAIFKNVVGITRRHRVAGAEQLVLRVLRKLARLYDLLGMSAESQKAHAAADEAEKVLGRKPGFE